MAPRRYVRTYYRFPLNYPVIFGGAPFVGEGVLTNLSLKGCSVICDREVLCGSEVRVSVLLDHQPPALPIDLGTIKWVKGISLAWSFSVFPLKPSNVSIARSGMGKRDRVRGREIRRDRVSKER